jgi:LysM repeat protein
MKGAILSLLLCCSMHLHARQRSSHSDPALDELRLELSDVKHELKSAQVELNLLDEKLRKQDSIKTGKSVPAESNQLASQITALDKKISHLEKLLDKVTADLRTLNTYTTQASAKIETIEQEIIAHEQRLSEVSQLKGTLTSIFKVMNAKSVTESSHKTYRVKSGDSLEKIARMHSTSIDLLKKLNQLQSDKIIVGQELRISDDPS